MQITNDILYVGVNDHQVDLFEGQYDVPNGMAYNSYVIKDERIAVMDTVDANFTKEWLDNIAAVLDGAKPDYLVVQHMEPDHAANIENFMNAYPDTTIVANTKTFGMMKNFFRNLDLEGRTLEVGNGESLTIPPSPHSAYLILFPTCKSNALDIYALSPYMFTLLIFVHQSFLKSHYCGFLTVMYFCYGFTFCAFAPI